MKKRIATIIDIDDFSVKNDKSDFTGGLFSHYTIVPLDDKVYISIIAKSMEEATELYNAALKELGKK